jgi:hypothetical protein
MKQQQVFFIFALMLFIIPLCSANLGTFKQNTCVDIRVLSNCTTVNLIEVNDGTTTFVVNSAMQKLGGQTFNYSFCSTSKIGTYTYSWDETCVDCSGGLCGNNFEVTPSGFAGNLGFYIIMLVVFAGLILLGFAAKEYWFLVLSGLGFIMLGIYSINNGVAGFRDMFMTYGVGIFEIGIGAVLSIGGAWYKLDSD